MIDEPVRLNSDIGWDQEAVRYFDNWMMHIEHNNEVQNGNSIKVMVKLNIQYEPAQLVVVNKEEAEQELLQDLHEWVSVLEQQVLAVLARYL